MILSTDMDNSVNPLTVTKFLADSRVLAAVGEILALTRREVLK